MKSLAAEERKRIELWAAAMQEFINSNPEQEQDISFIFEVLKNNETVPVILVDMNDNIISYRNLDSVRMNNELIRAKVLQEFKNEQKDYFTIKIDDGTEIHRVYYSDSFLLLQLQYYPFVQLGIVFLFILTAYFAFSVSRKAEQDQVWLGMSKETAHQLGTPISSLMAWVEILKEENQNTELINEVEKDVKRLEKITARFSKIGSQPKLELSNLYELIDNSLDYMRSRLPQTITMERTYPANKELLIPLNVDLFEWVIENICKNAVDAIGESGKITVSVQENVNSVYIDIKDTGKGIPKSCQKTVFSPGFTTKNRGWGLGLSLVKRIVEQYHEGKVFVKHSEIGGGTTFRIILNKTF
jgi:signal transduction histidine kinase